MDTQETGRQRGHGKSGAQESRARRGQVPQAEGRGDLGDGSVGSHVPYVQCCEEPPLPPGSRNPPGSPEGAAHAVLTYSTHLQGTERLNKWPWPGSSAG